MIIYLLPSYLTNVEQCGSTDRCNWSKGPHASLGFDKTSVSIHCLAFLCMLEIVCDQLSLNIFDKCLTSAIHEWIHSHTVLHGTSLYVSHIRHKGLKTCLWLKKQHWQSLTSQRALSDRTTDTFRLIIKMASMSAQEHRPLIKDCITLQWCHWLRGTVCERCKAKGT